MVDALLETKDFSPCYPESSDIQATGRCLNLSLPPKSVTAVIAEDTDEISSWLTTLAGITDPRTGHVSILGQDLAYLDKPAWQQMRTRIAYLGKHTRLMSSFNLLDNIVLPALYHRIDTHKALIDEAESLFAEIGFTEMSLLQQLPSNIDQHTYGWALIIRAYLLRPRVVILDDIFNTYSKDDSEAMLWFICSRVERQDMAALVQYHDMQHLINISTATIFIGKDSILQFSSRDELLQSKNEDVIELLVNNDIGLYG